MDWTFAALYSSKVLRKNCSACWNLPEPNEVNAGQPPQGMFVLAKVRDVAEEAGPPLLGPEAPLNKAEYKRNPNLNLLFALLQKLQKCCSQPWSFEG